MSDSPLSARLLSSVRRRLFLAALGRCWYRSLLVLCAVYVAGLLVARLTGYGPQLFTWWSLLVLPALALLAAFALHRRPTSTDAARAVDVWAGTKDLYLTLSMLRTSAGEYQPLVLLAAEQKAGSVVPQQVLPFAWQKKYWNLLWAPAVVVLGWVFLPQLDPFQKLAQANVIEQRKVRLDDSKKATALRLAEVRRQAEEREDSNPTEGALKELQFAFNKTKPKEKKENLQALMAEQKKLGEMWRGLSESKLKEFLKNSDSLSDQQFGMASDEELRKMMEDLKNGSAESLKRELEAMKDSLQKLAKTDDPAEQQKIEQELKQRMDKLERMARDKLGSPEMSAALKRAKEQLDLSKMQDLTPEALQAAMESMDLAGKEFEELAMSMKDMQQLEQALKTLQMAKKLNEQEMLDGEMAAGQCESLADYEELYAQLLAEGNYGEGEGMGDEGMGRGGAAPEDDSVKTGFKDEESKSQMTLGKVLMSMKTRAAPDQDEPQAQIQYKAAVQQVKQGVNEAILQEQVPPGYVDGIKRYFDALEAGQKTDR